MKKTKADYTDYTLFGDLVMHRLIDLKMTREELAKAIGINPGYLTSILQGERKAAKQKEVIKNYLKLDEVMTQQEEIELLKRKLTEKDKEINRLNGIIVNLMSKVGGAVSELFSAGA